MSNANDRRGNPWIRAIACALMFILAIWFLATRYSCRNPPGKEDSAVESKANSDAEGDPSGGAPKSSPQDGEPGKDGAKPEREPASAPKDGGEAGGSPASNPKTSEEKGAGPGTPTKGVPDADEAEEANSGPKSKAVDGKEPGSETQPQQTKPGDPGEVTRTPVGDASEEAAGEPVGGLMIEGERLGVILDTSDSMTRYLPGLRAEIRSRFQSPVFLEVEGCLLEPSSIARGKIPTKVSDISGERESVMDAIRELIEVHRVDSIYWFSDLQDERTGAALRELGSILEPNESRPNGVRLYVRSTDSKVDESLAGVVNRSGGSFEVMK
jgi:hypothetical protein